MKIKFDPDTLFTFTDFLYWYTKAIKIVFFALPFLVIAWYCFNQYLAGTPEPQWWLDIESAIGVTW